MIDAADRWLSDAWEDRHQLGASFLVGLLCIHLHQDPIIYACAWGAVYIAVGMLADLVGLVESLHDCVHEAAKEAAVDLLRASDQAQRQRDRERAW